MEKYPTWTGGGDPELSSFPRKEEVEAAVEEASEDSS
jgi:hypothetical protein